MSALMEITVPSLGESVTQATVAHWLKKEGEKVAADETILELETDKVTLEVNAPSAGVLSSLKVKEGATVEVGDLLALLDQQDDVSSSLSSTDKRGDIKEGSLKSDAREHKKTQAVDNKAKAGHLSPAVRKVIAEQALNPRVLDGSGKDGRILKGDVLQLSESKKNPDEKANASALKGAGNQGGHEERVPMTRLRKTIAKRLKDAQNTAALLTTFNEVDMSALIKARNRYKDTFEKKYGIKLGFMSFFVKAAVVALKEMPAVNAEINGEDIIYKNHYDIGVAVSTPQGLIVPVIKNADHLSFAEVEQSIANLAKKGRDGTLAMTDMMGGTFTITNGGVFGSLLSTPIVNPPQSAILGMHKIQERPIVVDGQIVARPMMYVALTYDHRIIDGREAVSFLVRVKECIENPERILLAI